MGSGPVVGRWLGGREVVGSNPARTIVNFLEQEIYLTLLHSTQVYKWVPVREISQCAAAASGATCKQPTYDPVIRGLNGMSSEHA